MSFLWKRQMAGNVVPARLSESRYENERMFHNQAFTDNTRGSAWKFYSISNSSEAYYLACVQARAYNARLLELGCGRDSLVPLLAETASSLTGIDISEIAIKQSADLARTKGLKARYFVMNAENTTFETNSFDLICGTGILHHLDLRKALPELARILKPGGSAIFLEPLGHNPLINVYRMLTPNMRTEDEHPLLMEDLDLIKSYFGRLEARYFHLCSLVAVPFRNTKLFPILLRGAELLDRLVFRLLPSIGRCAWVATLVISDPHNKTLR